MFEKDWMEKISTEKDEIAWVVERNYERFIFSFEYVISPRKNENIIEILTF